jgi:release factor glutamine methyltransferase
LFAGDDGLADLRVVVEGAPSWLRGNGWLIVEIGYRQADAVTEAMSAAGFIDVVARQDLAGRDRFVIGRLSAT